MSIEKMIFINLLKKYPAAVRNKRMNKERDDAWKKVTKEYSDIVMFTYKTDYLQSKFRDIKSLLKKKLVNLKYMLTENIEDRLFNWEKDLLVLNYNERLAKSDDERIDKFDPFVINAFTNSTNRKRNNNIIMNDVLNKSFDDELIDDNIKMEEESSSDTNEYTKDLTGYVEKHMFTRKKYNKNTAVVSPTATNTTCTITKDSNEIAHKNEFIKIFENNCKLIDDKLYIENIFTEKDKLMNKQKEFSKILDEIEKIKNDVVIEISDDEKDDIIIKNENLNNNIIEFGTGTAKVVVNNDDKNQRDLILEKSGHGEQVNNNNNNFEKDEIIVKVENINDTINCEIQNNNGDDQNYNRSFEIENLNKDDDGLSKNASTTNNITTIEFNEKRPFRQCRKRKMFKDELYTESNIINETGRLNKRKRLKKSSFINNNNVEKLNLVKSSKNIEKGLLENIKYEHSSSVESVLEEDENNNGAGNIASKIRNVLDIMKSYKVQLENLSMEEINKCLLIQQIQLNYLSIKYPKLYVKNT